MDFQFYIDYCFVGFQISRCVEEVWGGEGGQGFDLYVDDFLGNYCNVGYRQVRGYLFFGVRGIRS